MTITAVLSVIGLVVLSAIALTQFVLFIHALLRGMIWISPAFHVGFILTDLFAGAMFAALAASILL